MLRMASISRVLRIIPITCFSHWPPLRWRAGAVLMLTLIPAGMVVHEALAQAPSDPGGGSLDSALRLIADAQQSYVRTADYMCQLRKREVIRNQLQAENVIAMRVRTKPFSVYLRWQGPGNLAGQEACYVAGKNNGLMRVHSSGLLRTVGFVSMDPHDPRCLENSRHAITEAGIGNLIERYGKRWQAESRLNRTQVRLAQYDFDKRRCTRVETIHPDNRDNQFSFYRSLIYFDQSTHLPIRVENYDWPRAGGDPNGTLVESYSYVDLRLNVGLPESTFSH